MKATQWLKRRRYRKTYERRMSNMWAARESEWNELARYNSEVYRGIQHTPEHKERMAQLQQEYNDSIRAVRGDGG